MGKGCAIMKTGESTFMDNRVLGCGGGFKTTGYGDFCTKTVEIFAFLQYNVDS